MTKRIRNKPLRKVSLKDAEDAIVVSKESTVPSAEPQVENKIPSPGKSPLLAEPVDLMEHAANPITGGQAQNQPQSNGETFKMDQDFFSTPSVQPDPVKQNTSSSAQGGFSTVNQPPITPVSQPLKPDAPEQHFNLNAPSGPEANMANIPPDVAKQAAEDLADTIGQIYTSFIPSLTHELTHIKSSEIRQIKSLESSGDLLPGSHQEFIEINKDNKKKLEERAKSDMSMIKKPLKKFLEVKNVQVSPQWELVGVLIFVAVTYFFLVKEIKKSNNEMMDKLRSMIVDKNKKEQVTSESDVPLATTEEVIK
jgi:hypothetical protein